MMNNISSRVKKIEDLTKEFIDENEKVKEYILKEKIEKIFKEIDKNLIKKIFLDYYENGIIHLKVLDSTSRHFIHTNKNKILEKINLEVDFKVLDIGVKIK
ncbi:MAG: hypothetical protein KGV57_02040 [Fusobacterium sp.]|nr:hypothetical protein [Fusobacterium sp.]